MYIVLGIYIAVLAVIWKNWLKLRPDATVVTVRRPFSVSIIIPCRNEENRITHLLNDLLSQIHCYTDPEIIVVDDHSEDNTRLNALTLLGKFNNGKLISLSPSEVGKKAGLRKGIESSSGQLIITLDGDIRLASGWYNALCNHFVLNRSRLIIMPVMFSQERSLSDALQTLEMISIMSVTAGAAKAGSPILCNGANLAFHRSTWDFNSGHFSADGISSGDDLFFLFRAKKRGKGPITWLHDRAAIALTSPPEGFAAIIKQRVRWASKSAAYRDVSALLFTGLIWLTNLAGFLILLLTLAGVYSWSFWLIWIGVKSLSDIIFIAPASVWFGKTRLLVLSPLLEIIYPPYVMLITLASLFYRPHWKGRAISLRRNTPVSSASQ